MAARFSRQRPWLHKPPHDLSSRPRVMMEKSSDPHRQVGAKLCACAHKLVTRMIKYLKRELGLVAHDCNTSTGDGGRRMSSRSSATTYGI